MTVDKWNLNELLSNKLNPSISSQLVPYSWWFSSSNVQNVGHWRINFERQFSDKIWRETHRLTPFFPSIDIAVREISGLIQTRSRRCSGKRIQSSQNLPVKKNHWSNTKTIEIFDLRSWPTIFDFVPDITSQQPAKTRKKITSMKQSWMIDNEEIQ